MKTLEQIRELHNVFVVGAASCLPFVNENRDTEEAYNLFWHLAGLLLWVADKEVPENTLKLIMASIAQADRQISRHNSENPDHQIDIL